MATEGLGTERRWVAKVAVRFCSVEGVSVGRNGASETNTQKSLRRVLQQSVRFQRTTVLMVDETPRSTCHQALVSALVAVTELSKKLPSVLPSTAELAAAEAYPGNVLLCAVARPIARLVGVGAPPVPDTCTSARLR